MQKRKKLFAQLQIFQTTDATKNMNQLIVKDKNTKIVRHKTKEKLEHKTVSEFYNNVPHKNLKMSSFTLNSPISSGTFRCLEHRNL